MDFKKLLESMDRFAGQEVGQTPGDQVRGTEKAAPNKGKHPFLKRLVGELKQPKSVHKYAANRGWSSRKQHQFRQQAQRPLQQNLDSQRQWILRQQQLSNKVLVN